MSAPNWVGSIIRTDPHPDDPPGYVGVLVDAFTANEPDAWLRWRLPTWNERAVLGCRWIGSGRARCGKPIAAMLNRGRRRPQWWGYCPEHLYGRHLDTQGRLLERRLLAVEDLPAGVTR